VVAGATQLQLATSPTSWKVGDSVVVTAAESDPNQNETRTILAINGSTVTLNSPLFYDHLPPSAGLQVHVANLTRNAVIESETTTVDRRGHVMFMHSRNVDVYYAGFYRLGRTNKLIPINDPVIDANWNLVPGTGTNPRARYPVHFHRSGSVEDGNPSVVHGSAVVDSPGWGFVNHSSFVDITDNVAYDVDGAAFSTEVGDEVGSFQRNIAIGSVGSGELPESRLAIQDFGHQGDGFWFQGGGVTVTDNVAAGNTGQGFMFFTRALVEAGIKRQFNSANLTDPTIANGAPTISVGAVPIKQFERNLGYASGVGLSVWYNLEDATHNVRSYLQNSTFWNNEWGINLPYAQHAVLQNIQVLHSIGEFPQVGIGVNAITGHIEYNNLTVIGYHLGVMLPGRGINAVNGGYYDNHVNFLVNTATVAGRVVTLNGPIAFGSAAGSAQVQVYLQPNFDLYRGYIGYAFNSDLVILNYGPFVNQRAYYALQAADAIPFPTPVADLPPEYVGLTNQQLWDDFGVALGNAVAPAVAMPYPGIQALVAPAG
jgi:hypothetical protein